MQTDCVLTDKRRSRSCRPVEWLRTDSSTVGPEVRATVRDGPIAEIVAVADRVENRCGTGVDAVRTALVAGWTVAAELEPRRYVGPRVRVGPVGADLLEQRHSDRHDEHDDGDGQPTRHG